MKEIQTDYGTVRIAKKETLFKRLVDILETRVATCGDPMTVGLTGGSTPKAFYEWAVENDAISPVVLRESVWSVSDERMVSLDDAESNFGTADREFLRPIGVSRLRKNAWPVSVDPHSAATVFEMKWQERFGESRAFDLCLLGMGDDGHTASIFPESPLMVVDSGNFFAPVEVPGKGWRLSITPYGLGSCGKIVIMVTGAGKAERLKAVLEGPGHVYPVQLMSRFSKKVEWLVDTTAAADLSFSESASG